MVTITHNTKARKTFSDLPVGAYFYHGDPSIGSLYIKIKDHRGTPLGIRLSVGDITPVDVTITTEKIGVK